MGADMIGYFVVAPENWKPLFEKHETFLEGAFEAIEKEFSKQTGPKKIPESVWEAMGKRGVYTAEYIERGQYGKDDEELLEEMKADLDEARRFDKGMSGRDHRARGRRQLKAGADTVGGTVGYTTEFSGEFSVSPALKGVDIAFLKKLAETRRMKRKVGPEFGVEGEFYVDGGDNYIGDKKDPTVLDQNEPPKTQPGLWCQWVPSDDGTTIYWDGGEKFYHYVEWIAYLIEKILKPRGYVLDGEVEWRGEEADDRGLIVVKKNKVYTREFRSSFGAPKPFVPRKK